MMIGWCCCSDFLILIALKMWRAVCIFISCVLLVLRHLWNPCCVNKIRIMKCWRDTHLGMTKYFQSSSVRCCCWKKVGMILKIKSFRSYKINKFIVRFLHYYLTCGAYKRPTWNKIKLYLFNYYFFRNDVYSIFWT